MNQMILVVERIVFMLTLNILTHQELESGMISDVIRLILNMFVKKKANMHY